MGANAIIPPTRRIRIHPPRLRDCERFEEATAAERLEGALDYMSEIGLEVAAFDRLRQVRRPPQHVLHGAVPAALAFGQRQCEVDERRVPERVPRLDAVFRRAALSALDEHARPSAA